MIESSLSPELLDGLDRLHVSPLSKSSPSRLLPFSLKLSRGQQSTPSPPPPPPLSSSKATQSNTNHGKSSNLSHVPCKFFKQGTCTAGANCIFSHNADPASGSSVCKYFLKGNCKFGTKCALLHTMPPSSDRNKPNRTLSPHSPSPSPMHSHGAQTSSPLAMSLGASAAGTAGAASAGFAGQLEIRSPPIQSPHTLEYSPSLYAHPGFLEQDTAGWLDPRPHFPHFARVPFSSPYSTLPSSSAFTVEDQRRSSKLNVSSSFYHSAFSVDPFMVMSGLRIPSRGDFISLSLLPLPPPPPSSPPPLPPPQSPPPQSPPPQSSSSSSLGKSAVKGQTNVPEFNQSYLDVPFNAMYYPSTEVLEEMEFSNTDLNDAMLPSSLNELLTPTELQQRQSRHHPQYMSHAWAYCDSHSPGTDERDERDEREEREERDEKVNMPQSQTDTTERRIDILGLELLHNYRPSLAAYPVAMAQGSLNPMRSRNQPSTWTLFPHDKFSEEEEEEEEEEDIFFHTMKIASAINIPKGSSDIANTAMSPQSIQSMYLGKDQEKNRQPMLSSAFSPFSSGEDDASFYMDDAEMGKSASVKTHDPHKGQGMSPHKSNFICPPWVGLPKLS